MPFLALVCIQANVLMMVCHSSPSEVDSRFIGTINTISSSSGSDTGSGFGTFLFRTFDIRVQVTSSDLDLLRRL